MAEPGDPHAPDDHDDLIGFASPASLQGRVWVPAETKVEPDFGSVPPPEAEQAATPDALAASVSASIPVEPEPAAQPAPAPAPGSTSAPAAAEWAAPAASIPVPSPAFANRSRRRESAAIPGGGMGLYAVYALILFAVPTLGVSALIGLFAVTGRVGPEDALSRSHFVYQQRTLWTAVVAVLIGLIFLLVPFGLGPAIMFAAALWLVIRGAAGVWALKAGRPIADPRGWWI